MAACSSGQPEGGGEGKTEIALWTPQAGSPKVEVENMQRMIDEFTEKNPQYSFTYKTYPFDSYATSVQGAAAAGQLPCMLAVDAPVAPNWAWAQYLQPLDLPSNVTDQLIPGAKGTYQDKIYSAGYWDAGLSIFARKSVLESNGIRIPTLDKPWTGEEFNAALETLKGRTGSSTRSPLETRLAAEPHTHCPRTCGASEATLSTAALTSRQRTSSTDRKL
jgi:multiple sugar transport system substrate-binding protein